MGGFFGTQKAEPPAERKKESRTVFPHVPRKVYASNSNPKGPHVQNKENSVQVIRKIHLYEKQELYLSEVSCRHITMLQRYIKHSISTSTQHSNPSALSSEYLRYIKKSDPSGQAVAPVGELENIPLLTRNSKLDEDFLIKRQQRMCKPAFQRMMEHRRKLPAYQKREAILDLIEKNQVVVLMGETGCGKTTQVPQYILDSYIGARKGSLCKIICTQPRRISAVGVAERIADELCAPCGEKGEVGYHIRLESKRPREFGSILFCTIGIMLIQLQTNPLLSGISHILVDEVHERDKLSDFFLMNLRDLLDKNRNLKVVLMSATVNAEEFSAYFGGCPMIQIPGRTHPVKSFSLEDMIESTGYVIQPKIKKKKFEKLPRDPEYEKKKELYIKQIANRYSCPTIQTLRKWNEDELDLGLIAAMLKYISYDKFSKAGTVLVFLPGWQEIETLFKQMKHDFPATKFLVIPLHSQTSSQYQKDVLKRAPIGIRKIILSTNIAETSITIDDCTVVIDSGKFKLKSFDPVANLHLLKPQWVAMSNVTQRRGRAGRTQPGVCYHMFTKAKESMLDPYQVPEMQRCSLEELILNLKILKQCDVITFFQGALSPPKPEAVEVSLNILRELNAITVDEKLTPLGFLLAKLPVDVHVGKMLLYAAIFSCLDPILSIAACLSFKDPFTSPMWQQDKIRAVQLEIAAGSQSDHLLFATVMEGWRQAKRDREVSKQYCFQNYLSFSGLKMLMDLKAQYSRYLKQLGFLKVDDSFHPDYNVNSDNEAVVKAIICASLYPNIAKVCPRSELENPHRPPPLNAKTKDGDCVAVHPKSINAFQPSIRSGWLAYHMKMKSTKIFIHNTTDVSPICLLLFGSKLEQQSVVPGRYCLLVDDWIQFNGLKSSLDLILYLRHQLDDVLTEKICSPSTTNWKIDSKEIRVLQCAVDFIISFI